MSVIDQPRFPRVDEWMMRYRVPLAGLSWEGARLLGRRLAVRRRVDRLTNVLLALGAACSSFAYSSTLVSDHWGGTSLWWLVAMEVLLVAAAVTHPVLVARGERPIAAELSRRVAADRAISSWRRIGALRVLNGVLVLIVSVAMLAGVAASHYAKPVIATYAVLLAAAVGAAVVLGARELARPTLAVDDATLRVDDRWRSQAIYVALLPLAMLFLPAAWLRIGSSDGAPGWVTVVNVAGTAAAFVMVGLEMLAQAADRRRLRQGSADRQDHL